MPRKNYWNHENLRISYDNTENHDNLGIPNEIYENNENQWNL